MAHIIPFSEGVYWRGLFIQGVYSLKGFIEGVYSRMTHILPFSEGVHYQAAVLVSNEHEDGAALEQPDPPLVWALRLHRLLLRALSLSLSLSLSLGHYLSLSLPRSLSISRALSLSGTCQQWTSGWRRSQTARLLPDLEVWVWGSGLRAGFRGLGCGV